MVIVLWRLFYSTYRVKNYITYAVNSMHLHVLVKHAPPDILPRHRPYESHQLKFCSGCISYSL